MLSANVLFLFQGVSGFVFFGCCFCTIINDMLVIDTVFSATLCARYRKILPTHESFANDNFQFHCSYFSCDAMYSLLSFT